MGRRAIITGVGHYAPPKVLSNKDLERMVDTSDEWIMTRTGIRERRILEDGKGSSYMGIQAAKMILKERGISPEEIELIIVATVTPDTMFPSTACRIQDALGAKNAWGFDLNGACTGFVFALFTGAQFIESGQYSKVLVIGTDKMSAITDYTDRTTCVLFGDAAGAVLLEPAEEDGYGILDAILHCDGSGAPYLHMMGGGSLHPASHETVDKKMHYIYQEGRTVFKFAVTNMAEVSAQIVERNRLKGEDIRFFIPHQANLRIIDAAAKRMGLHEDQVVVNIDRYGNTTAATIPLALSEVYHDNKLRKGDYIVMAAFGAGFTWGSLLLRWAI
ncbi:MAG: ketoacyl-ACP synthase III [Calditrichaeota bacterium]|nr:MAG: ketoacyl-ACP synthase III [Calditrichota bacterium]